MTSHSQALSLHRHERAHCQAVQATNLPHQPLFRQNAHESHPHG